jgi:Fic family protein
LQWLSEVGGLGVPRRDRKGGSYDAYVPDRLVGRTFAFDGATAADVSDAERALASFDVRAVALTSTEALARLLLRAESVASSHIEGLVISPQRLLRVALDRAEGVAVNDDTAIEVLGNVDAMSFAVQSDGDITVERLLEVHRRLLAPTRAAEHTGRIRDGQNWIGGSDYNPFSAAFVPPPANEVLPLLEDLCAFCNDDTLPAVAQAAIAHAQFETIHPFADGNGRTGRALISMVLRRRGLARRAPPPISLVLATRAKAYIAALDATRFVGSPTSAEAVEALNRWIAFFAAACTRAVADAVSFEQRVEALVAEWRARLGPVRADASALALLTRIPEMPILTVRGAAIALDRTFAAANSAINALVTAGILTPTKASRRNRVFEARELVDTFTVLKRQLASPDGNTRTSPPERVVPIRPKRRPTAKPG